MNRIGIALLATLAVTTAQASEEILPQGWRAEDNTLVHEQSGARCPTEIEGFARKGLSSAGAPDLGICTYAGDKEREGLIRVRQYVPGQGETALAIQNDKELMDPPSSDRQSVSTMRMGPGPTRNGALTQQLVLTIARNGVLIDCIGRHLNSDDGKPAFDFAMKCVKAQPEKK